MATVIFPTEYPMINAQPIIHAIISPKAAKNTYKHFQKQEPLRQFCIGKAAKLQAIAVNEQENYCWSTISTCFYQWY
jgi:hypothetical protein